MIKALKVLFCLLIITSTQSVFAQVSAERITCPNEADIAKAELFLTFPYTYNVADDELGYYFAAGLEGEKGDWLILLPHVGMKQHEKAQDKAKILLPLLHVTAEKPSMFQSPYFHEPFEDEDEPDFMQQDYLPLCFYKLPNSHGIAATAVYFSDDEDMFFKVNPQKAQMKLRKKMLKFAKNNMFKIQ